jgi:diadenylate cyclase
MIQTPPDFLRVIEQLAPGTALRSALQRIVQHGNGALVVLGTDSSVEAISTGGFVLRDAVFTPAKLAELAKMDGAIVLDNSCTHILRANTHLLPDADVLTTETGARYRTAERVARQTGKPVVAVSEERHVVTLFMGDLKRELESPRDLTAKINQQLQTLERFRHRLDEAETHLTRLEVADLVTVRSVVSLLQRAELVRRIGDQIAEDSLGLGLEGGMVVLQHNDLVQGAHELRDLVVRDYVKGVRKVKAAIKALEAIERDDLYAAEKVAAAMGLEHPDSAVRPLGYRMLANVPRLPSNVQEELVKTFKDIQKMVVASVDELDEVAGVGGTRALELRRYFDRQREATALSGLSAL